MGKVVNMREEGSLPVMALPEVAIRRERFARAWLSNGFVAKAAAIKAGFPEETAEKLGPSLLKTPEVMAILERARRIEGRKTNVTLEAISLDLDDALQIAKAKKNATGMVAASSALMKLHGLESPKQIKVEGDISHGGEITHTSRVEVEDRIKFLTDGVKETIVDAEIIEGIPEGLDGIM
jgi:phage terminase small subunit